MRNSGSAARMERLFQALGDRTRLRLLNLMRGGEVCVCFAVDSLGELQPKVSRHLAYLRKAGLVSARRDGKWVRYGVAEPDDPETAEILQGVLAWAERDPEMRLDRERYAAAGCCSTSPLVRIDARATTGSSSDREHASALADLVLLPAVQSL